MTASRLDQLTAAELPRRFGRYELQAILGEGGMARVFEAVLFGPAGFRKQVAVKVIKPEALERTESKEVESFIREARLGGLLKHPNIVDVYELGEAEEQLFISMELVRGLTLSSLIRSRKRPPAAVVLEIATGVAAGLASAHALRSEGLQAGLVHRDLKPSNVLVSWDGAVKVADFGIATTRHGELAETAQASSRVRGTPSYMSPEHLCGQPVDGRSDVFALGLVLTELATATYLPRNHLYKRMMAGERLRAPVLPESALSAVETAVPGLSRILLRCLEPLPDDRHPTAEALLSELETLRESTGFQPRLRTWLPAALDPGAPVPGAVDVVVPPGVSTESVASTDDPSTLLLASSAGTRTNLGTELDAFVGRESELEKLGDCFEEGARLVTVKGTGGTGKTRFARRFARRHWEEFSGGAWFIDLTEARIPMGLVQATSMPLGVPLQGVDFDALVTQVGHAISGKGPVLLVFDNFEQVVEHAAVTVKRWLEMAPEARCLVTSREPLRLEGEQVFPLAPLPEAEGAALFELRARSAGASWEETPRTRAAIVGIVQKLDGLPLAIELAAARTRLLTPTQLLERLSNRFKLLRGGRRGDTERQSTLRGLIDWSWDLLKPWEQSALAQLSVFRDGFFMESAEAVLDLSAWPDAPWSLDVVGSLLDRSLLHTWDVQEEPRFGMYVSIQEYAAEKLASGLGTGTDLLRTTNLRHGAHYASFGTEAYLESLDTHGGVARGRALASELENLLAGVETCLAAGESEVAAGCALAAGELFEMHGPFTDGIALLKRVSGQPVARGTQGRLIQRAGYLLYMAGRSIEALEHCQQALAIHREVGSRRNEGITITTTASLQRQQGRIPVALEHTDQALAIHREVGNRRYEGMTLGNLGLIHREQGRLPEALEYWGRALAIAREVGDRRGEGITLEVLAFTYREQGRILEALEHYQLSLAITREVGNRRTEGITLGNLALVHHQQGRIADALEHHHQSLAIAREVGNRRGVGVTLGDLANIHHEQGRIQEALEHFQQSLAIHREVHNRRNEGVTLGNLGDLLFSQGDLPSAETHLQGAIAITDEVWPLAAGAFRGSLALIRAMQGAFVEARSLIVRGEPQVRDVHKLEHGKFLCKKARVERLAGDLDAATSALAAAAAIELELGAGPDSKLGQVLAEARGFVTE